ncbi:MAG: DUF1801 domain-containing protein [Bacteroidota bacterium]
MAEVKTRPTTKHVADFLMLITDPIKRADCFTLCQLMEEVAQAKAMMWGEAIVGFNTYIQVYKNGSTMDWPMMGFSPRKQNISLYIMGCDDERRTDILSRLGKHKTGKACIYIKSLTDINMAVLKELCQLCYDKHKR